MAWLSWSGIVSAILVGYVALALQQLYKLVNPLSGVEISGPGISPLWSEGHSYDIFCFLSTQQNFQKINVTLLQEKSQILLYRQGLVHKAQQEDISLPMTILAPTSADDVPSNGTVVASSIFKKLRSNSTQMFLHVVAVTAGVPLNQVNSTLMSSGNMLHGYVQMAKYDVVPKSFRHRYLLSDFGWVNMNPVEEARLKLPADTVISYWKPEVSVRLVSDFAVYPFDHVPEPVSKNVVSRKVVDKTSPKRQPQQVQHFHRPSLYVDEIGLTSDKYVALNDTVDRLPLHITVGPMSSQRWLLMAHLEESLSTQKGFGFTDKDIDDVRRMITETSLTFLLVTIIASVLHLLFEFLAFQSDVKFWQDNKSLAGLSTRSVITDLISQIIVFLFLVDSQTSLLITVPSFIAILIQCWKMQKATGFSIRFGGPYLLRIEMKRWQEQLEEQRRITDTAGTVTDDASVLIAQQDPTASTIASDNEDKDKVNDVVVANDGSVNELAETNAELTRVTLEADSVATTYLGGALLPVVAAFIVRSLVYEKHASWYSWAIGSLTSCVYTFGFIFMCPQLYINHKLKSVSHLPWQYLIYKFLNTFVDDLFAFIIKMPVMHRLSVFRDDLVFLVYLYQRWHYRVDVNRPVEK